MKKKSKMRLNIFCLVVVVSLFCACTPAREFIYVEVTPKGYAEKPVKEEPAKEDSKEPILEKTINMGEINTATTRGTLGLGETHWYTFTIENSGGYNQVGFYIESNDFNPRSSLEVDGKAYSDEFYIMDDIPTSRVPADYFLCLDRANPVFEKTFVLTVSSEDFGTGDYEIHYMGSYSVASADHCVVVITADGSEHKEEAVVEPTQKPTEKPTQKPTQQPTQIPTQGPAYYTLIFKNYCSSMTIYSAVHYLNLDGTWTTQGWFELAPGESTIVGYTTNRIFLMYAVSEDRSLQWANPSNEYLLDVRDDGKFSFVSREITNYQFGTWVDGFDCP